MEILLDLVFDGIEACIEEIIEYIGDKIRAAKMKKRLSQQPKRS